MVSVIINGAGISGAILALILSKLTKGNIKIYLIEACSFNEKSSSLLDSRYIALSKNSYYKLLSFFDANMVSILFSYSTPIKQIEVSYNNDNCYGNKIIFSSEDYRISNFGYVVKLHDVKMKIFNLLQQWSNIKIFCPARLQLIKRNQFDSTVILDNGNEITSGLLIAADGSYSSLATSCGMQWDFFDYKQIAVVTNITTSFLNEGRAFEIFTSLGSLALLPISNNKSSLIWCIPTFYKKEVSSWSNSQFCEKLQKIFGWELGYILNVDTRYYFSLFLRKAKSHISHRLALVSNAAQTLHPIAAQGFNLGLRDVIRISEIISYANMKNIDIGSYSVLEVYEKNRQLDQYKIIVMTHSLIYLFNDSYHLLKLSGKCLLTVIGCSKLLRGILIKIMLSW